MNSKMMKKLRHLSLVLAVAMMLTALNLPSITAKAAEESGVGGFVNRCYQVTLGRDADPSGYSDWTGQLLNGKSDGAHVAFGFVFSDEYTKANKSNGDFVTDMYTLFLGRTPDEAGYNDWVGQLDAGADRQAIFAGFANSTEFFNICTGYGVTAGVHNPSYDRFQVNNVNMFVARMYRVCFNRLGDQGGQADWVMRLLSGELSGIDCARGFILSNEYQNLSLSNEEYVENMYLAFMGRGSDPSGFQDWVSKLKGGYTRDEIFAGFANSNEFQQICDSYGINRGTYTAQNVHNGETGADNNQDKNTQPRFRLTKESHYDDNGRGGKLSGYIQYYYDGIDDEHPRYGLNGVSTQEYMNVTNNSYILKDASKFSTMYHEYKKLSDQKFHEVKRWLTDSTGETDTVTTYEYSKGSDVKLLSERSTSEQYGWYFDGIYNYDKNGKLIHFSHIEYSMDGTPRFQYDIEYENNGPNGQVSYEKRVSEGELCDYTEYVYNGTQLEKEYFHHFWTPESDDYNNASRYTDCYQYEYDAYGNLTKKTRSELKSHTNTYEVADWTSYEYEAY